jgi:hypothetical protein
MNRTIEYCNIKTINDIAFQATVKGHDKLVEDLCAQIRTGEYEAFFTANATTLEAKKRARRRRANKYNQRKSLPGVIATSAGPI